MENIIENIKKYVRAANYLTVTQIYLQDNFLLKRKLESHDIKPKLFGHWGTCPGINFVYSNLQYLVKKYNQSAIFVLGPGHGVPALHANLFLEATMQKYHKQATLDAKGIAWISKSFSWPYGLSSHTSPETPGQILEGGELGYSLATAYGAILDNPDLLAVCLIGDGEAETGALAAAWHINKLIDPGTNGAVLSILHVNGLKISGPTIFGRMSNEELITLFKGYGYEPFIVEGENIYEKMLETMEKCYQRIKEIQGTSKTFVPHFPMIILKTPKGWTTVKELRGKPIEGTIASHQVVMPNVRNDEQELEALEKWLTSYHFKELFDEEKGFSQDILDILPKENLRIGDNPHVFGKKYKELNLPNSAKLKKEVHKIGELQSNAMRMAGTYLKEVFRLNENEKNFRLMSPDETYSNRLDDVFQVTARSFVWPIESSDKDITRDGRVMEMLSEHTMHGLAQGYILTGRHSVFTTYEAFAQIVSSMGHMYQKFLKYVRELPWRRDIASMNYLLTSTAWRQEHNGYSHQNPSFISSMLEKQNDFVKIYFPVDDNSMLAVMEETLASKNQINTIVAGKTPEPRWLTYEQAKESLKDGLLIWEFHASNVSEPDIVLVGIGDYVTKEAMAAIELLHNNAPEIKIRFVNIIRLSARCSCKDTYHPQIPNAEKYFTRDKSVIINFHGYPEVMKAIMFDVKNPQRFSVHGYEEHGGTTTPFDMQVRNKTDRYHLAIEVLKKMEEKNIVQKEKAERLIEQYKKALEDHYHFITRYGRDPEEIENWEWGFLKIAENVEDAYTNILKNTKTIAVVGLSDDPERHSHRVAKYFQSKGFKIIPVNPNVTEVLGEKSYPDVLSVPNDIVIDVVDIFRRPTEVIPHLQEVVERGGIKTVWLQEGVSSREAEDFAEDYGLHMITNFCIMEAYKKLRV